MRVLITFAVVVIVVSVTLITAGHRRPTCNKKAFWPMAYKKNNLIGWDDFVNHIVGSSYINIYNVYLGEPIAQFFKGGDIFVPDGMDNTTIHNYWSISISEMGSNTCLPVFILHNRTDKKACKNGQETFLELSSTALVDSGVRTLIISQDPAKYYFMFVCIEFPANGTCSRGFLTIKIRDTRVSPSPGDEIDLSSVPWDKVAYDLYKLTGLKFGDPKVIYAWLGLDCAPYL